MAAEIKPAPRNSSDKFSTSKKPELLSKLDSASSDEVCNFLETFLLPPSLSLSPLYSPFIPSLYPSRSMLPF